MDYFPLLSFFLCFCLPLSTSALPPYDVTQHLQRQELVPHQQYTWNDVVKLSDERHMKRQYRDPSDDNVEFIFKTGACETYMINDYVNCYEQLGACINSTEVAYCAFKRQQVAQCQATPGGDCTMLATQLQNCRDDTVTFGYAPCLSDGFLPVQPLCQCGYAAMGIGVMSSSSTTAAVPHATRTTTSTLSPFATYYTSTFIGASVDTVVIGSPAHPTITLTSILSAGAQSYVSTFTGVVTDSVIYGSPGHPTVTSTSTLQLGAPSYISTITGVSTDSVVYGSPAHSTITRTTTLPWSQPAYTSTLYGSGINTIDTIIIAVDSNAPPHATVTTTITLPWSVSGFMSTAYGSGPIATDTIYVETPDIPPHRTVTSTLTIPWSASAYTSTLYGSGPSAADTVLDGVPSVPPPRMTVTTTLIIAYNSSPFTSTITGGPGPLATDTIEIGWPSGSPAPHQTTTVTSTLVPGLSGYTRTAIASAGGLTDTVLVGSPRHATTTLTTTLPTGNYSSFTSTIIATAPMDTLDTLLYGIAGPYPTGSCGAPSMLDCWNSYSGHCCSSFGFCGSTDAYCGTGCQPGFGYCNGDETSSTGPVKVLTMTRTHSAPCITA